MEAILENEEEKPQESSDNESSNDKTTEDESATTTGSDSEDEKPQEKILDIDTLGLDDSEEEEIANKKTVEVGSENKDL